MVKAPISQLKKAELVWLASHHCKHRHSFLSHYACHLAENKQGGRIGFFDIEASNLDADFGICLCYCIKDSQSDKIFQRVVTAEELRTCLDREVIRQCIKDLKNFDKIITFYGVRYDVPFIRTRAVINKIPFPNYGEQFHKDIYFTVRNKFKLSSNRLENSCRVLLGRTEKTRIDSRHWLRALMGDPRSLAYILDHCKRDVRDLERLYNKVLTFGKPSNTSI